MRKWFVVMVVCMLLIGCAKDTQDSDSTLSTTTENVTEESNAEVDKDGNVEENNTDDTKADDAKTDETKADDAKTDDTSTEQEEVFVIDPNSLRALAANKNMFVGAAIDLKYLKEEKYKNTLKNEFNMLVLENMMKWASINPNRDKYIFAGADVAVQLAKENNMEMRGHTLIWHQQLPKWLTEGEWSKDELLSIVDSYVEGMVTHFKGSIHSWDVLNEIFEEDGTFRKSMWYETTGEDYIRTALIKAREMDPDAKLIINDYNVEFLNAKSDGLYNLVKQLKEEGTPIDGVGFQCHFIHDQIDFDSMEKNIQRFNELGLEVQITELDIRIKAPVTDDKIAVQGEAYKKLMEIALRNKISVFVTWGISDAHSWVPGFFLGYADPLLFDNKYEPKSGYTGLIEALKQ